MKPIAIITARGGSKRIPGKNIKNFLGKPIIAYSIQACLESKLFSHVIVSTDSLKIAKIARKYGASVPFLRSAKNSDDHAGTADVAIEVIKQLSLHQLKADTYCIVYPTAVFLTKTILKSMYREFKNGKFDSLISIGKYASPIQRALKLKRNKLSRLQPKFENYRSQDLETFYFDVGQVYWVNKNIFLKTKTLMMKNSGGYILPQTHVQDIDTVEDWDMAELKMRVLKKIH